MSDERTDGGPAFPRPVPNVTLPPDEAANVLVRYTGMSLRDYFAAKAMHAEVMACRGVPAIRIADRLASAAYEMADAMLRARQS